MVTISKIYNIFKDESFNIQLSQREWNFITFFINNARHGRIIEPQDCGSRVMELNFLMDSKLCFVHGAGSRQPLLQLHPLLIYSWCLHQSIDFKDIFPNTIPKDITPKEYFTSTFFLENIKPSLSHNSQKLTENTLRKFDLDPLQDATEIYVQFAEKFANYEKIELYEV